MIDFRFHLVSIVSIFLALAVGIVLGAGPLQGSIGTQLTDQVSQLRQEKDTLRTQLDDASKTVKAQEQYAGLVAPTALAGALGDATVALVVSPDAAGKFSQDVQQALTQGGARITTIVTLRDDYRDPGKAGERATSASEVAPVLGLTTGDTGDALLADVLATVLVHPRSGSGQPGSGSAQPLGAGADALRKIKDAGFIDYSQSDLQRADLAVMLSGPIAGTTEAVTAQSSTLLSLATALDTQSAGLVAATGPPSTAVGQDQTTSLVTVIRKNGQASKAVSTVDHADTLPGAGVIVLALARQRLGSTGHFGISSDAQAAVPPSR